MNTRPLLKAAGIVLVIHGSIELLSVLSLVTSERPNFVFPEIRESWQQAIFLGVVAGMIRIVSAVGVFRRMKWGVVLGILFSTITFTTLVFYLPFGIMDSLLAGIVLVLLVMVYWGGEKIAV